MKTLETKNISITKAQAKLLDVMRSEPQRLRTLGQISDARRLVELGCCKMKRRRGVITTPLGRSRGFRWTATITDLGRAAYAYAGRVKVPTPTRRWRKGDMVQACLDNVWFDGVVVRLNKGVATVKVPKGRGWANHQVEAELLRPWNVVITPGVRIVSKKETRAQDVVMAAVDTMLERHGRGLGLNQRDEAILGAVRDVISTAVAASLGAGLRDESERVFIAQAKASVLVQHVVGLVTQLPEVTRSGDEGVPRDLPKQDHKMRLKGGIPGATAHRLIELIAQGLTPEGGNPRDIVTRVDAIQAFVEDLSDTLSQHIARHG